MCCAYRDAADADTAGDGEGEEGYASGESRESSEGWEDVDDDEDDSDEEEEDAADDDAASGRRGSEQRASASCIAKVGFGTKPASWILVWLRAHGSFPGFVLEMPRRGRQKRKARSRGFCVV